MKALPKAVKYLISEDDPPTDIDCSGCWDYLTDMYMRHGRWSDAVRVARTVCDTGAKTRQELDEKLQWIETCQAAADAALSYIRENPGVLQGRIYSLLPHVNKDALKLFTWRSWQIEKAKSSKGTTLYVMGHAPGQPPVLSKLAEENIDPRWRIAACIDCETTGLDHSRHELIELAILLFAFDTDTGAIIGIIDEYAGQREPDGSIPRAATKVHGLTKAMLKGKALDLDKARSLAQRAEFYIAHNAEFDRGFAGPYLPAKHWLCSLKGIDWASYECRRKGLQALLEHHRIRTEDSHRALADVHALLRLLATTNTDGQTYLKTLLEKSDYRPGRRKPERRQIPTSQPPRSRPVKPPVLDPARRSRQGCLVALISWVFIAICVSAVAAGVRRLM